MDLLIIGGLFLGVLIFLYILGMPVGAAIGVTSIVVMLSPYPPGFNVDVINSQLIFGLNSFTYLAVPFYLLLGRLMNHIGMTQRLFRFASSLVGQFRGGICYVNVVASMLFSGMSGLATADAAGLGRVEYTAMRDGGYPKWLALGVTGSSSIIGPIIPPSVPIIIYAVMADESIGELFLAGILPGILLGILLLVMVYIIALVKGFEQESEFDVDEMIVSFKGAAPGLFIPVLVIGGITGGYFTATEAGAIAILYTLALGMYYGKLELGGFLKECTDSMVETASLLFIIAVATIYGHVALQLRLPIILAESITSFSSDPTVIILLLVCLLLFVGTFMSAIVSITILVPILMPVFNIVGIDPVYFGIIMVLTLMLGILTPPFGMILFVLEKVTDASLEEVFTGIAPFYVPILTVILLLVFIPELVTFIPDNFMG